ncbi:MAG: DUF4384 domain-containing protein, partial [Gammaproteobacteria bacterium]|nr:DUF4384 domain-containing protein [Gammaproteobacteria bacterium]
MRPLRVLAIETLPRLARRTPGAAPGRTIARAIVCACALALASPLARAAADAGVSLDVFARTAGSESAGSLAVRDGGVLRSGDGIQLHLRARRDAYVYVIAYGSSNSAALVFPYSGKAEDARVRAGSERIIPRNDLYLSLDDVQGRESLFTIVTDAPVDDISGLMARMEAKGDDLIAVAEVVRAAHPASTRLTFKHLGEAPLVGVDLAALPRSEAATAPASAGKSGFDLGTRRFASETPTPAEDGAAVFGPDLAALSRGAS